MQINRCGYCFDCFKQLAFIISGYLAGATSFQILHNQLFWHLLVISSILTIVGII